MQRGMCHQELGQKAAGLTPHLADQHLLLAAGDFGTCIGMSPDFAWGHSIAASCMARAADVSKRLPIIPLP